MPSDRPVLSGVLVKEDAPDWDHFGWEEVEESCLEREAVKKG